MADVNHVVISGNLARDPETKKAGETKVVKFTIIVNAIKKEDNSSFTVECWDHNAEFAEKYFKKGTGVLIEGALKSEHWEDAEGKKSRVKIKAKSLKTISIPKTENKIAA